jgi:hypothetical protein
MADRVVSGLGSILAEAMAGGRVARNASASSRRRRSSMTLSLSARRPRGSAIWRSKAVPAPFSGGCESFH